MKNPTIYEFLRLLDEGSIYYTLAAHTLESIMVIVTVPGERWEIDFGEDGEVNYEVFVSRNGVESADLSELFRRFGEDKLARQENFRQENFRHVDC